MRNAFKNHWSEYCIEAWALGMFMISACLFTALLEHPLSPWHRAISSDFVRRGIIGAAMGLTAVGLIYSPWGKRSGAHMNPAVTWTFWRFGKIKTLDAIFYTVFQFLGGWLGVVISALILGSAIADPRVAYAVTVPGQAGAAVAWGAEFGISFFLMLMILYTSNQPSLASRTGIFAGVLIALYVLFEAPLSGMSMNPARTLGSAIPAGVFDHLWIYFTAPPIGMLAAAELYRQFDRRVLCAKLVHDNHHRCIFCGHPVTPKGN
jgi:aquaporin Z